MVPFTRSLTHTHNHTTQLVDMFFFLSRAGTVFLKRTNCDHERDFGRGGGTRLTGDGVVSDAVVKVEAASSVRSVGHADNVGRN